MSAVSSFISVFFSTHPIPALHAIFFTPETFICRFESHLAKKDWMRDLSFHSRNFTPGLQTKSTSISSNLHPNWCNLKIWFLSKWMQIAAPGKSLLCFNNFYLYIFSCYCLFEPLRNRSKWHRSDLLVFLSYILVAHAHLLLLDQSLRP